MANNFKEVFGTGVVPGIVFDRSGHQSGVGTYDDPKITPTTALLNTNIKAVIGGGYYSSLNFTISGEMKADGKVIIKNSTIIIGQNSGTKLQGIKFINTSFNARGYTSITRNYIDNIYKNCTGLMCYKAADVYVRCVFVDCSAQVLDLARANFSIFDGTCNFSGDGFERFENCYVSRNSIIRMQSPTYFTRNNVEGLIQVAITGGYGLFAIQDGRAGTPQDHGYPAGVSWLNSANVAAVGGTGNWDAAVATCINDDPLFNNTSVGDYRVQAGSPMIGAATGGANIGNAKVGVSIYNNTVSNTVFVAPDGNIDVSASPVYRLLGGSADGEINYVFRIGSQPLTINEKVLLVADLFFDSSFPGGTSENNNVPDSQPVSTNYPQELVTTGAAPDNVTLICANHGVPVGQTVRVNGEDRLVDSVPDVNTIILDSALRAIVGSGVSFTYGSASQQASLRPNRLSYKMRFSTQQLKPANDAEWDNGLNPSYGLAGAFFTMEWDTVPELIIDGANVYGNADPDRPFGVLGTPISATWIELVVVLTNNFK